MTTQKKMQTQTEHVHAYTTHCGIDKRTLKNRTFAYVLTTKPGQRIQAHNQKTVSRSKIF